MKYLFSSNIVTQPFVLLTSVLLTMTFSQVFASTYDGNLDAREKQLTGVPAADEALHIDQALTATDSLGLPIWTGASDADCTVDGSDLYFTTPNMLPCGTSSSTSEPEAWMLDGFVRLPVGATSFSISASNEHPTKSPRQSGIHFYSALSDEQPDLEYRGGGFAKVNTLTRIEAAIPIPTGACAAPDGVAFRMYAYDASGNHAVRLSWNVTGGADDTAGAWTTIPVSHLSSVAGFDNDLDASGVPDYQEVDADNDGIADWIEEGEILNAIPVDTDSDSIPNCLDEDSDNDGIPDSAEGLSDFDGDGIPDYLDTDPTSSPPGTPTVVINDGGDALLSLAEIAAGVTATITTPADAVAGDTLTVDTDGDGVADHTIILTAAQAAGGTVDITVDPSHIPADGVLTVSAEVMNSAGTTGSSTSDTSNADSTAPGAPTVQINDGGDEFLSAAEIAAGVTATITTPADSVAGDTVTVDTDGDGIADHTIVLTAAQAGGGTVDITVEPTDVPVDGVLTVSAEVSDLAGNTGTSANDVSTADSSATGAPSIVINDGGDGQLSAAEISAGVTATIATPADAVAGDTLTVDTDGDGIADHTIVLTAAQAGGGTVDITIDPTHVPADGVVAASAEITDVAGNTSASVNGTSSSDSTAPGTPAVLVNDGGDELLSAAEIAAGVTATITTPANSVAGDTLTIDTDGDGVADHTIVLTAAQAGGGSVDITIDPTHVPADGVITVGAQVTDSAGNTGVSVNDTSTADSTAVGAPTVLINDGGDELLSAAEIAAGVTATITTPADSVAGDTLTIDTDGDGVADHTIVLTAAQAGGGTVDITIDPTHVPADGSPTVSAEVTDAAGNTGTSANDMSATDSTVPGAPTVLINDGGDELLSAAEIAAGVTATITTPADSLAGDTLTIDTDGDGIADHSIVLTAAQAGGGTVDITIDPTHVPADGAVAASAEVTDPAGNTSASVSDTSSTDSMFPSAPSIQINDGGDEFLSAAEIAAGVTATITTPVDSVAGDTLKVDTDSDGVPDHTIVLTAAQAAGGTVDIIIDPTHIPADGVASVSAEVTDLAGNTGATANDTSTADSTPVGSPAVHINDGGDGLLSAAEIAAGVTATITTPADSVAGDILTVDTDGDGVPDHTIVLTAAQAGGGTTDISIDPTHIPADGLPIVSAEVTDSAGNTGVSANDDSNTDSTLPGTPTVTINDGSDELLSAVEIAAGVTATITTPADSVAGDTLTVDTDGDGVPDHTIVLTAAQAAGGTVDITVDPTHVPADGVLTVSAEVTDPAGNTGASANDTSTTDSTAADAPSILINDGGDELLSAAEIAAGVTATITTPANSVAGDTLTVDTDGDGVPDHTIVLTAAQAGGGAVDITIDPTHVPADGVVAVSAEVTDLAGNISPSANDTSATDSTAPEAPIVVINDGGDELLSAAEIAAGVTATITTPADSVAGDTLMVDTDGDGIADHTIVLTAAQAAGGTVDINIDATHVPADGVPTVSVEVTDAAGNTSASANDTSTADSTAVGTPTVLINDGGDELLSAAEIAAGVTATITTPADSAAGDTLSVDTDGDGVPDHTIVLTAAQAGGGTAAILIDPTHVPTDGLPIVSAEVTDSAGNTGVSATDISNTDSTVPGEPIVAINDGGDELLSAAEIAAGVTATIATPADSLAGDTLTVDTDGDGIPDHTIVLTAAQASGGTVDITIDPADVPADGLLTVTAEVTDPAGNTGASASDTSSADSTGPSAPSVQINDGGDSLLSAAEIAAGVTATITTPADSVAGDTLTVDTDGDGIPDHTIVLTAAQAGGGTVDIAIDTTHIPVDGVVTVAAEVTDSAGNTGAPANDASTADSTVPGAPVVAINDGGDELLSATEIAAGVTATITTPADSVAGDTLMVDTDGDGVADHTIVLTAVQAAGGSVDINIDPTHIPADGLSAVSVEVSDPAGNTSASANDTSATDSTAPEAPIVVINDGGDELLSAAEIAAGVTATITTPADSVAGDTLMVDTDGDGIADHTIVLTAAQAAGGTVDINIDATHVPADGVPTVSVEVTDAAGNTSASANDTSTADSTAVGTPTVLINDGGDELLSAAEIAAGVTATITTPADSAAGDTLTVDTDGDGIPDHTIVLTAAQAGGGTATILIDPTHVPADGLPIVSAEVTDSAGNTGVSANDISNTDSTLVGAPTVLINDSGDELLSAAEIAAGVTATIATPADSLAGDTLTVDTDGDGIPDHTIVLTAAQASGGTIEFTIDPADVPADGLLTVTAEVTDPAGNSGASASDTSSADSTGPSAPSVQINDGGDDLLSAAEIAAGVTATITTPADSVAGDTLTVDTDGDGIADHTIVLTAAQAAGGTVDINIDPTHVPADGVPTVSAEVIDAAGNTSASANDTSTADSTAVGTPTVLINDGGDELLSAAEIAAGVTATITTPADSAAGDTLSVDTDGDGVPDHTIVLTAAQAGGGTATILIDPTHVPTDGLPIVSAEVTDSAGNTGVSATDISNTDSTVPGEPIVAINDGGDELLSAAEIAAGVTATITTPANSVAGDTLTVDTDGDGVPDHMIVLTAAQAAGGTVDVNIDPTHIPADGLPTVSAAVTDSAGNSSASANDTSATDSTLPDITAVNVGPVADTTPLLSGTSSLPDGGIITITDADGSEICVAMVASGEWSCESTLELPYGTADLVANTSDAAGNPVEEPFTVEIEIDTDGDGLVNSIDADDDNDGIPDLVEQAGNASLDTDNDGIIDSLDLDSDNDGILDVLEAGGVDADDNGMVDDATDTDNDGIANVADANPTTPDAPEDAIQAAVLTTLPVTDSDGDGVPDFQEEDSDNDGIPDAVEGIVDTDGDGVPDYQDLDSDNDGIPDVVEGTIDTDGDGVIDALDTDSDNDGMPDSVEAGDNPASPVDTDGDGLPDVLDLDSDNDGIDDAIEAGIDPANPVDTDNDGVPDALDIDSDGDGVIDSEEGIGDTDGDGIPDGLDLDADNDGIADSLEGTVDTDGDGISDALDLDSDNDGIPDAVEFATASQNGDSDGDGIADWLDLDSDNDGLTDTVEAGGSDTDGDGIVDGFTDTDNDGLDDAVAAMPLPVADLDGDGNPDHTDLDSDGDGLPDLVETLGVNADLDGDGRIDNYADADGNGQDDSVAVAPAAFVDTDEDGLADHLDLDSDNDGVSDIIEAGGTDADADGMVDQFADTDADGIPDAIDVDVTGGADADADGIDDLADADFSTDVDTDGDGIVDQFDADPNGDGFIALDGTQHSSWDALPDLDGNNVPDVLEVNLGAAQPIGKIHTGLAGNGCSILPSARASNDPMLFVLVMSSVGIVLYRRKRRQGNRH